MIICCDNCSTKFRVADDAITQDGRFVHCTRCDAEWLVTLSSPDIIEDNKKDSTISDAKRFTDFNHLKETLTMIRGKTNTSKNDCTIDSQNDEVNSIFFFNHIRIPVTKFVLYFSFLLLCTVASVVYYSIDKQHIQKIRQKFNFQTLSSYKVDPYHKQFNYEEIIYNSPLNKFEMDELELSQISSKIKNNSIDTELQFGIINKSKKMEIIRKMVIIGYNVHKNVIMKTTDMTCKILYPSHNIRFYIKLNKDIKRNLDRIVILVNDRLIAKSGVYEINRGQKNIFYNLAKYKQYSAL